MANSVYKQALDQVASQVKTLADAVAAYLTPQSVIPVRALDWNDTGHNLIQVCWMEDITELGYRGTNIQDEYGYPCVLLFALPKRPHWDTRRNDIHTLKQNIRAYYHHRRRMSAVSEAGTHQLTCTVDDNSPAPRGKLAEAKDVHTMTVMCWFQHSRTA